MIQQQIILRRLNITTQLLYNFISSGLRLLGESTNSFVSKYKFTIEIFIEAMFQHWYIPFQLSSIFEIIQRQILKIDEMGTCHIIQGIIKSEIIVLRFIIRWLCGSKLFFAKFNNSGGSSNHHNYLLNLIQIIIIISHVCKQIQNGLQKNHLIQQNIQEPIAIMYSGIDTTQTYILVHMQSQLAMEAPNQHTYSSTSLELGPPNENNSNQMWIVEDKGKSRYEIILGYPDQVLTADGNSVTLKKGTGDKSHQYWLIDTSIPNRVKICQAKKDKNYLGVNNHRIVVKNNPPFDMIDCWEFKAVRNNTNLNRASFIRCMRTNKLMDVPASQTNQGVTICIWDANYRFNQRWKIYRAGEVYIIKSLKTDLNLDISGEDYSDGTKIIQWHSTGAHNQFWNFQKKGDNVYRICSWYNPALEIGHNGSKLIINNGCKFTWKIEGFFPDLQ